MAETGEIGQFDDIVANLERIKAGDVDAVEAWANDPQVCHGQVAKAALLSLCRQLREARRAQAEIANAALRLSRAVHRASATCPDRREK